jgi:hypothetical protein
MCKFTLLRAPDAIPASGGRDVNINGAEGKLVEDTAGESSDDNEPVVDEASKEVLNFDDVITEEEKPIEKETKDVESDKQLNGDEKGVITSESSSGSDKDTRDRRRKRN